MNHRFWRSGEEVNMFEIFFFFSIGNLAYVCLVRFAVECG